MWEPDPSWRRLPGAAGPSTVGIWLTEVDGLRWVVKRLDAPEHPAGSLADPAYAGSAREPAGCSGASRRLTTQRSPSTSVSQMPTVDGPAAPGSRRHEGSGSHMALILTET